MKTDTRGNMGRIFFNAILNIPINVEKSWQGTHTMLGLAVGRVAMLQSLNEGGASDKKNLKYFIRDYTLGRQLKIAAFQRGDVSNLYVSLHSNFRINVDVISNHSDIKFKRSWVTCSQYCWRMLLKKKQSEFVQQRLHEKRCWTKSPWTKKQSHCFNVPTYSCLLTGSGVFDWCRWTFNVEKYVGKPPPDCVIVPTLRLLSRPPR